MLKREEADKLYSIIVKRFNKEQPQRHLTSFEMDAIWYELYGKLCRGETVEDLEKYCNTVKLHIPTEKEEKFAQTAMKFFDGAYKHLLKVLKNAFGGTYCRIRFEHVDKAGFWFTFELVNDKTRQTYRVNHEEALANL